MAKSEWKETYLLRGIDCPNCAEKLAHHLESLPFINELNFHYPTERLYVTYQAGAGDLSSLRAQLEAAILAREPQAKLQDDVDPRAHLEAEEKARRQRFRELLIALVAFFIAFALRLLFGSLELPWGGQISHHAPWLGPQKTGQILSLVLFALAYLVAGKDVYKSAFRSFKIRTLLSENFLMIIASLGAIAIGEYPEAVAVMLFYAWGEYMEQRAVAASRRSIEETINIMPDTALLITHHGPRHRAPEELQIGDHILIHPGARIPTDGVVIEGESQLDTKAISGESLPVTVRPGSPALSGSINGSGLLTVEVTRLYRDSTVANMLSLIEECAAKKSPTERFITRFARYYTPAVVGIAVLIAILPPLLGGQDFSTWLYRALLFLVASCPCALVISVPLAYYAGLGAASREGILVRGGAALEELAGANTLFLDKTGTLTEGNFAISKLAPAPGSDETSLLRAAVIAEAGSQHPLAEALRKSLQRICIAGGCEICPHEEDESSSALPASLDYQLVHRLLHELDRNKLTSQEKRGLGIITEYDGHQYLAGNARLMAEHGLSAVEDETAATVIHVARDGEYLGALYLADLIKSNARETLHALTHCSACRIDSVVMLTGDKSEVAAEVSESLGISRYAAELLPEDKLSTYQNYPAGKGARVFIGDGINDAPVLMASDVGVAMGGIGQAAAIEAADIIIANDNLEKFHQVLHIAKKTRRIVRENIGFALLIKFIVLLGGALGYLGMWTAVFADVGVAILAIFNALRILPTKRRKE